MSDKLADPFVLRLARHLRLHAAMNGPLLPSEATLMEALNVGRQQLRESLRVLEGFGAIEARQGARRRWLGVNLGHAFSNFAQFTGSPLETTGEMLMIRQALETGLLSKVMPLHTHASLQALRELALAMERRAEAGRSFADLDQQFHLALFAPLRNNTLEGVLGAFWTLLVLVEGSEGDVAIDVEVAAMHRAIVDAMAAGDYTLARYELDTHFYGVRKRVVPSRLGLNREARTPSRTIIHT